ncbi:hypothetical protein BHE74_00000971 [Ensete ventricosum]|nr:hypothetical protein BHE74_00000971 [Ensete ventricosum]
MFVGFIGVGVAIFGETTQLHPRKVLNRHGRQVTPLEHAGQEAFHVRADPIQQVCRLYAPYVGRTQRVVMRRCARRQQHLRNGHAVLHSSGNQLQRLDAREYLDLGLSGTCDEQTGDEYDKNRKKSGHDDHSMV